MPHSRPADAEAAGDAYVDIYKAERELLRRHRFALTPFEKSLIAGEMDRLRAKATHALDDLLTECDTLVKAGESRRAERLIASVHARTERTRFDAAEAEIASEQTPRADVLAQLQG